MTTAFYNDAGLTQLLVALDRDMIWTDEFNYNPILKDESDTVDNGIWYNEVLRTNEIGRKISLESMNGFGMQKKSTVQSLKALDITPNKVCYLSIVFESKTVTKKVRFNHSDDEGGVAFRPAVDLSGLAPNDFWYEGRIKLIIVS